MGVKRAPPFAVECCLAGAKAPDAKSSLRRKTTSGGTGYNPYNLKALSANELIPYYILNWQDTFISFLLTVRPRTPRMNYQI